MAKYYVPFTYEKGGKIEVEAASPKEAMKAAEKKLDKMSWKDCGALAECIDDSAMIDYEGIVYDENGSVVEIHLKTAMATCGLWICQNAFCA